MIQPSHPPHHLSSHIFIYYKYISTIINSYEWFNHLIHHTIYHLIYIINTSTIINSYEWFNHLIHHTIYHLLSHFSLSSTLLCCGEYFGFLFIVNGMMMIFKIDNFIWDGDDNNIWKWDDDKKKNKNRVDPTSLFVFRNSSFIFQTNMEELAKQIEGLYGKTKNLKQRGMMGGRVYLNEWVS